MRNAIENVIYGVAIGDAVGCPVQFIEREDLKDFLEIDDMTGYGTYNKPAGTWTDDTSLTLALADSLAETMMGGGKIDYTDIMRRFALWMFDGEYTTEERAFDIGRTCEKSISAFRSGIPALECGGHGIRENGNGSIMRISPIVFYLRKEFGADLLDDEKKTDAAFEIVQNVSRLTHAHPISTLGCCIYCAFLLEALRGTAKEDLRSAVAAKFASYISRHQEFADAARVWERLFSADFPALREEDIKSSGYVVDTLEAAIWCFYGTANYRDCILKCVNLGDDTDSVAAVAGGFAGLYYGEIPDGWVEKLRGKDMIDAIAAKLTADV